LAGAKMLTHGRGYTAPPKPVISSTYRVSNAGDLPLVSEITPTYLVEKSNYFTVKADGFEFNRSLYFNSDSKGFITLCICSTNEVINNEQYTDIILPAQTINEITIRIQDRDGLGLDANRSMSILLSIEELEESDTNFTDSRRQLYNK
jgi:hypothetical protein